MGETVKVRWHIFFEGRVQGVGFRYTAAFQARALHLTGWVKNLWDGRVEMEIQGSRTAIRAFLMKMKGERFIRITHMDIEEIPLEEERVFSVH